VRTYWEEDVVLERNTHLQVKVSVDGQRQVQICIQMFFGKSKRKRYLWDLKIDGGIILKWNINRYDVKECAAPFFLRTASSGKLLWTRQRIVDLFKRRRNSSSEKRFSLWTRILIYGADAAKIVGNEKSLYVVRFQVFTAASMKKIVFWDTDLCSPFEVEIRFRCAYCLHQEEPSWPWWWMQYTPLKRKSASRLYDALSQKTITFIFCSFVSHGYLQLSISGHVSCHYGVNL
jgi:hypothetical protein